MVRHKQRFYTSAWARYDLAERGIFRVVPPESRWAELRQDYERTKIMIFGQAPPFEDIMASLEEVEDRINQQ